MTLRDWLDSREPAAPHRLAERIRNELAAHGTLDSPVDPSHLTSAGIAIIRDLESRDCTGREAALDLLAADALVTYAFEAAAASAKDLRAAADLTLAQLVK